MEPSLYIVEAIRDEEHSKIFRAKTITPRGKEVLVEIRVDRKPAMIRIQEDREWLMSGVIFTSLGKESDGFINNLAQLAGKKVPPKPRMRPEVHFACSVTKGTLESIGTEEVDLALWFKMPFGFRCGLRLAPWSAWLFIEDQDDDDALETFQADPG